MTEHLCQCGFLAEGVIQVEFWPSGFLSRDCADRLRVVRGATIIRQIDNLRTAQTEQLHLLDAAQAESRTAPG